MDIHWTYEGCDEQDIARISAHWERVQAELAGKVAELADSPSELRMSVEREDSDGDWRLQAALHLPGKTLVAETVSRSGERALDHILRGLALDIDQLEPNHISGESTPRRQGLEEVVTLLEGCRSPKPRSEAFISFLSPLVDSLEPYVEGELRIREYEGTLEGESLTSADVLNEVIVGAWERFPRRNRSLALDLWLVQLVDEAIQRLSLDGKQESLEDESSPPSFDEGDGSWEEFAEMATSPDASELRENLPGAPSVDAWDELDFEVKQSHLAEMLAALPRERRQAFLLNVVHGFNSAEIADFQGRSVSDVDADIAGGIATVQRQFQAESSPDLEEPYIRRELREFRRKRH